MDTERSIEEIEVALAEYPRFNYLDNVIAYNVKGWSRFLALNHECDMLVMSKSGYLTEIEIKRSWKDFLADFKKRHIHIDKCQGLLYRFYYCVPDVLYLKCKEYIDEHNITYAGIITYSEDLEINIRDGAKESIGGRKLFIEEKYELARLAALRITSIKRKLCRSNTTKA